jgi:hypothetical protein
MTMSGPKVARRRATVDTESDRAVDSHNIDLSPVTKPHPQLAPEP